MLEFPLHDGFFPQITLTREEVKYYKRLGKERVSQLIRIIEDAECAYKWTNIDTTRRRSRLPRHARLSLESKESDMNVSCQRASFLDFQPVNKTAHASTLLKASVHISDTNVDEVLRAVAKVKTKDFRKTMRYMHTDGFVDGRTLFTFPHPNTCATSDQAPSRPCYSYRAIKWHAFQTQRPQHGENDKIMDFCFLEYVGKRRPHLGSHIVGFCVQESISREREVPTLEHFGIARGYLSRMGIIISKTHQKNTLKVTSICQIDGDLNPIVRGVLEELMQKTVCAVAKIPGLVARQRVSSLRFVEQWQWVPNSDRKACAVCLRGFYFRRKHHCRTCGEVVCSSCALLRELEEPIFDITHLRVCSTCMTSAGARQQQVSALSAIGTGDDEPASLTSNDTESYIRGLRSPQHNSYENMIFHMRESRDRDRRQSDLAMEVLEADTELRPTNSSLKSNGGSQLLARDKIHALTDVVTNIREVRDTINLTMSKAAPKEHQEEDSDEIEEFNDMYSEITSIREALESSVSNFDAALANATNAAPAMYYSGPSDRSQDSLRGTESERDVGMTANQLRSVARITFAAARATRQAGQAFLSVGERQRLPHEDRGQSNQEKHDYEGGSVNSVSVASYPTVYDSDDSSARSPDPYSASNYEKIMATFQPEQDNSDHEEEDNYRRSSYSFADSVRRATEIYELEKKIFDLQRSLEKAQRKLSVIDSDEPEPEVRSRQRLDAVRDRSAQVEIESVFEIFGERGEDQERILGDNVSLLSSGPQAMSSSSEPTESRRSTTKDLVLELRGVMASNETHVRASGGSRKPLSRSSLPPLPLEEVTAPLSPLPKPLPLSPSLVTEKKKKLFQENAVYHLADQLPKVKESPIDGDLSISKGTVKTNQRGQVSETNRPSAVPTEGSCLHTLGTTGDTRYVADGEYGSSSSGEDSYDDSSDNLSLLSSDDFHEPHLKTHRSSYTFFVEEDLDTLLKTRKAAEDNASPSIDPIASPSSPLLPAMGMDERDELRELMASLVRPRSSSVPFQSGQMGGASSGESLHNKPSWSDDAPDRIPTAHQVEEAVYEIHACLASCRCECPSDTERAQKLTSIYKVLRSLHREGVRSKFRTLQHDDIRYSKMLKTNPSIIKLLKLAGYVSLQQKLTMRRVDQQYLALFLRELEHELNSSINA